MNAAPCTTRASVGVRASRWKARLPRPGQPDRGFTCVRFHAWPRASIPHGLTAKTITFGRSNWIISCSCLRLAVASGRPRGGLPPPIAHPCPAHPPASCGLASRRSKVGSYLSECGPSGPQEPRASAGVLPARWGVTLRSSPHGCGRLGPKPRPRRGRLIQKQWSRPPRDVRRQEAAGSGDLCQLGSSRRTRRRCAGSVPGRADA